LQTFSRRWSEDFENYDQEEVISKSLEGHIHPVADYKIQYKQDNSNTEELDPIVFSSIKPIRSRTPDDLKGGKRLTNTSSTEIKRKVYPLSTIEQALVYPRIPNVPQRRITKQLAVEFRQDSQLFQSNKPIIEGRHGSKTVIEKIELVSSDVETANKSRSRFGSPEISYGGMGTVLFPTNQSLGKSRFGVSNANKELRQTQKDVPETIEVPSTLVEASYEAKSYPTQTSCVPDSSMIKGRVCYDNLENKSQAKRK